MSAPEFTFTRVSTEPSNQYEVRYDGRLLGTVAKGWGSSGRDWYHELDSSVKPSDYTHVVVPWRSRQYAAEALLRLAAAIPTSTS